MTSINEILKSENLPAVMFFFGEEEFLLEESLDLIEKRFAQNDRDRFNFDIIDGETSDLSRVVELSKSYPMLSEKRFVLVKNFNKLFSGRMTPKSAETNPFVKYIKNPADYTVLVLCGAPTTLNGLTKKIHRNKKVSVSLPYQFLIENHTWIEFSKVYENEFPAWAERRIKNRGKEIPREALELLCAQSRPTLRDLAGEIDKLMIYTKGRNEISVADVNDLVGAAREHNVFELQAAIGRKDAALATKILQSLLSHDRGEMLIITILTRFFAVLMKLLDERQQNSNKYQLAQAVGVSPHFLDDYTDALKKFTPAGIENAFVVLCETDEKLKTVSTDGLLLMQQAIYKIIHER
ncbi:MAG: DNA polymerase III subunit delta [Bacteroidota bacterium]